MDLFIISSVTKQKSTYVPSRCFTLQNIFANHIVIAVAVTRITGHPDFDPQNINRFKLVTWIMVY